jgi:hypothetical protein
MREALAFVDTALTREGRYDAIQLAKLLDWSIDDVATYVGRSLSSLYRNPDADAIQDQLGKLAGLYNELVQLFTPAAKVETIDAYRIERGPLEPSAAARAWLRTSIAALDGSSPKDRVLKGDLGSVHSLLREYASSLVS